MSLQAFTDAQLAQSSRLVSFEKAEIKRCGFVGAPVLIVSGEAPCLNMQVSLQARIYIRCPEYWEIEVVGTLPGGFCLPAIKPYKVALPLTGTIGSIGVEVVGANKTQKFELEGGCSAGSVPLEE